ALDRVPQDERAPSVGQDDLDPIAVRLTPHDEERVAATRSIDEAIRDARSGAELDLLYDDPRVTLDAARRLSALRSRSTALGSPRLAHGEQHAEPHCRSAPA